MMIVSLSRFASHRKAITLAIIMMILAAFYAVYTGYSSRLDAGNLLINPQLIPDFLSELQPYPGEIGHFDGMVCFTLISEYLWENGNEANELSDYLLSHIQFMIDGYPISSDPISQIVFQQLGNKYDEAGNFLGSFGGAIKTCFGLELQKGQHIAEVQVSTMSGTPYSYTWAFEVK